MRLLALETATLAGGAALLDDGRLIGESRLNIALTHSERLMAVVDRLLQDCGWDARAWTRSRCPSGPARSPACGSARPPPRVWRWPSSSQVAPVPTLDALAATLPFADAPVCAILDARKGEVYCSLYRWTGGAMAREWDYLALPPARRRRASRRR